LLSPAVNDAQADENRDFWQVKSAVWQVKSFVDARLADAGSHSTRFLVSPDGDEQLRLPVTARSRHAEYEAGAILCVLPFG